MAETARPKKETVEYFDEPAVLAEKIARLTEWVRGSKHFIAFTGAGALRCVGGHSRFLVPHRECSLEW